MEDMPRSAWSVALETYHALSNETVIYGYGSFANLTSE
jgi:hypothetical protein